LHKKTEILKDGTKVILRNLHTDDLDNLMKFYRALPYDDRVYLKVDVTKRPVVKKRLHLMEEGRAFRIVALHEGEIIGDGMLEISQEEWRKHQGEIRVIVARKFQRKGLGMIMMRELHSLAIHKGVDKIVVRMMKLGFRKESVIPNYVWDQAGDPQDLVIMTCDVEDFWKEMERFYKDTDWRRSR